MKVRKVFLLKEAVADIEEGRIFYDKKEKANHLIQVSLKRVDSGDTILNY